MKHFCKKYDLSLDQVKLLIAAGKISISNLRHDEIYDCFLQSLSATSDKTKAITKTCEEKNCDRSTVYRAIAEFE